ncbi:MAG: bifunctional 3,4-dihydroxy-2-butanone-4-phosphate synthase/GTP cyclohydrolase II [Gammaproteobacteria bacterium]|nr:bifunctional 3,4-dihydroxy-2-butanone-4-phosphate synthase/GTP cyclohydrolase II [Gammaproteobacteria bacterium]MDH3448521.1 bifunctional 3,4-dihydroxy-2-butanone-4-phosphate synthase/GTP cyclohydrolase II [Gammaproteobacteria bacterium]
MTLNSTQEIIDDIKAGKMVVIMDDEDRENEGDILMAAEAVTADHINFMAKFGRGLICLTLSEQRCKQLRLPLMVGDNRAVMETNFTISIEAAEGVTTGISAADRATTIHAAINPDATPESIVQPGHIFPVMARKGGVLFRAGHTEAGCDLAKLAGFEPAAVIVEILNDDGSMARRKDLEKFAMQHGLKIGTIEDLIRYRIENEHTVERIVESRFQTDFGEFKLYAFEDSIAQQLHLALVKGNIDPEKPVPVRVHVQNTLTDSLAGTQGRGWPLRDVMRIIDKAGEGVIVFLRQAETPRDMVSMIEAMIQGHGDEEHGDDQRTYGIGAQILADLGVRKMSLLSAPKVFHGISGFGLEVVDYFSDRG